MDAGIKLGKAYLVSRLESLLQTGRIHLPRTVEAEALRRELLDLALRVDGNGHERSGAFRPRTHAALACALGLATQIDPDRSRRFAFQDAGLSRAIVLGGWAGGSSPKRRLDDTCERARRQLLRRG